MKFYSCPYCWDRSSGEENANLGRLVVVKSAETTCHHEGGLFTTKEEQCKRENYKCKEVMFCPVCDAYFKISEDFLKQQLKKVNKDG